jgi:hypothetical protein
MPASLAGAQTQTPPAPAPGTARPPPAWLQYKNPYSGEENDISNPHRTTDEVTAWAQETSADVLSFGPRDYKEKLGGFKKYFVPAGWQLYAAYIKDTKLLDMVTAQGYSVGAIVSNSPDIVNHGPAGGVYHWIVRVPLTLSFFVSDAEGNARTAASGKYILYMDIARVATGGDSGVAVHNWRMDEVPK